MAKCPITKCVVYHDGVADDVLHWRVCGAGCTCRYGRAARGDACVRRRERRAQGRPRPHAPGQRRVLQLPGQPRPVVNRDAVLVLSRGLVARRRRYGHGSCLEGTCGVRNSLVVLNFNCSITGGGRDDDVWERCIINRGHYRYIAHMTGRDDSLVVENGGGVEVNYA